MATTYRSSPESAAAVFDGAVVRGPSQRLERFAARMAFRRIGAMNFS